MLFTYGNFGRSTKVWFSGEFSEGKTVPKFFHWCKLFAYLFYPNEDMMSPRRHFLSLRNLLWKFSNPKQQFQELLPVFWVKILCSSIIFIMIFLILSDNLILSSLEKSSNLVSYSLSVGQTSNYFAAYITP